MFPIATPKRSTHHCHTLWSDGKNSVEEMVCQAISLGFLEIGISDHLCVAPHLPKEEIPWTMSKEDLLPYKEEVLRVANLYKDRIKVRVGLEVDFFDEYENGLAFSLKEYGFDYLIGSVHVLKNSTFDWKATWWTELSKEDVDDYYTLYFGKIERLIASGHFDFVGHLDLPKKFGVTYSEKLEPFVNQKLNDILALAKQKKMAFEINTSGYKAICKESYPGPSFINQCQKQQIPLIINDDAHSVNDLGQFFELAPNLR